MTEQPLPLLEPEVWQTCPEPQRERNERTCPKGYWANRHLYSGAQCHICLKSMTDKATEKGWWVHMTVNLQLAPVNAKIAEELSQGWFPIGNACAKTIPLKYRSKIAKKHRLL